MNTILDRINEIALSESITITELERVIGASKGVLSRALKNKTDVNSKWIQNIVENYPLYSTRWLLTGEGNMFKDDNSPHTLIPVNSPDGGIPLVPIDAWAGLFHGEEAVALSDCEHFFVPAFKDADFLIPVRGDSMIPRYYSGDLVACKFLPLSDIFFQWGKVYVLDTNQGALIKKVRPGSSDDTITLISENTDYEPFELPRSCIYNIALVQGLIRSE